MDQKAGKEILYRITHPIESGQKKLYFDCIEPLVEIESEHEMEWYVQCSSSLFSSICEKLGKISPLFQCTIAQEVSWEKQSEEHSVYWNEETKLLHIPLSSDLELLLQTGAIFGDGSHNTTRLMISQLSNYVLGQTVVDIGHGNGVLTLASCLYGAKEAIGLEIEYEAVVLANKNRELNKIDATRARFYHVEPQSSFPEVIAKENLCLLMNMTLGDIEKVLSSLSSLFLSAFRLLVSGLLISQKGSFLEAIAPYQFEVQKEDQSDQWLFLALEKKP